MTVDQSTGVLGDGTYRNPVLAADWSDPDVHGLFTTAPTGRDTPVRRCSPPSGSLAEDRGRETT